MLETVYRIWFHNREDELIYLDFLTAEIAAKLAEQYHATMVEKVTIETEIHTTTAA